MTLKMVKFQFLMKYDKSYIKMTLLTCFFEKKSREDTRGHLWSEIWTKNQISIFFKSKQTLPQKGTEEWSPWAYLLEKVSLG